MKRSTKIRIRHRGLRCFSTLLRCHCPGRPLARAAGARHTGPEGRQLPRKRDAPMPRVMAAANAAPAPVRVAAGLALARWSANAAPAATSTAMMTMIASHTGRFVDACSRDMMRAFRFQGVGGCDARGTAALPRGVGPVSRHSQTANNITAGQTPIFALVL